MHITKIDEHLKNHDASCLIYNNEELIYKSSHIGVKPLLDFLDRKDEYQNLEQLILVDKVIGKAAMMLSALIGIQKIYTPVASEAAHKSAKENNILLIAEKIVPYIVNREKTGMCPIEKSVMKVQDPNLALENIRQTIQGLMAKKKK